MFHGPVPGQVGFNYLGRISASDIPEELAGIGWLPASDPSVEAAADPDMPVPAVVDINALVTDEKLNASFAYPDSLLDGADVQELAELWTAALTALVRYAETPGAGGHTPSDFALVRVGQRDIERWEHDYGSLADVWPLAPLQAGLVFHALLAESAVDLYTAQVVLRLGGDVDRERLRAAAVALLERYPNLRAGFVTDQAGTARQVIPVAVEVPWVDVDLTGPDGDARFAELVAADRVRQFDLSRPPLLRFTFARLPEGQHALVLSNHHVLLDGWSMPLLIKDLLLLYVSRADESVLTPVRSFKAFLDWVGQREPGPAAESWQQALAGIEGPTLLAAGARGREISSPAGEMMFSLDEVRTAELSALARNLGVTVNTVVQVAWGIVLGRTVGSDDVVFGATVSGRPVDLSGVESMVGLFINTIPVRVRIGRGDTVSDVLVRVQAEQARLLEHHHVGLAEIQSTAGFGALFDTLMVFESYPIDMDGLRAQAADIDGMTIVGFDATDAAHYPLSFSVQLGEQLHWKVGYLSDVLDGDAVNAVIRRLLRMLVLLSADPSKPVVDLDVLDVAERETVLHRWNETHHAVPREQTLVSLFDAAATRFADSVALVFDGHRVTYRELHTAANRLARWLIDQGVGPESCVGLAMYRSLDMVVATHAILASGAAYVPMDPDQPRERNEYILSVAAPRLVLSSADAGLTAATGIPVVSVDSLDTSDHSESPVTDADRIRPLRPANAAYMIFTSGSTGRPKGVVITHDAAVNQMAWMHARYQIDDTSTVLHKAPITFDVSVWELLAPLQVGARLVIAKPGGHQEPDYLARLMADESVTIVEFVPSMLTLFMSDSTLELPSSLRYLIAGGEALPPELAAQVAGGGIVLDNVYGPTEVTIGATAYRCGPSDLAAAPIGRAVWNTRAYVLDTRLRPVPAGVSGELYLAGVQVARGYAARADLTAERFVADPFGRPGQRLYRTGDLVRWNRDGQLEFLGRSDFQVKLRGLRIELGEIESVLLEHEDVTNAVVTVRRDPATGDRLVGYVVRRTGTTLDVDALREDLAAELPAYMVPQALVVLDALPLNVSGKLDRKALPVPVFDAKPFRAPATPVEEIVAAVFADVLGIGASEAAGGVTARVGVDDDFFSLGGNSLLATQLVARLGSALDTRVPVRLVFEAPTVAALAGRLEAHTGARRIALVAGKRPDRIPLSLAQQRMWFLNRFDGDSAAYNVPIVIRLSGALDIGALRAAVADLVARHEVLRTTYPEAAAGPVQVVLPVGEAVIDVSVTPATHADVLDAVTRFCAVGFDVTAEVPIRVAVFNVAPAEFVLAVVVHHISGDGSSEGPLARDIVTAYVARAQGEAPGWAPLPLQYADFAIWQRKVLGDESDPDSISAKQLSFWREALAGLPEQLDLPADRARPTTQSFAGGQVPFVIEASLHAALDRVARQHNATLFMVLHAALAVVLARLSNADDVAVGTPVSGRHEAELDDLIGMFVNTVVFRTTLDPSESFGRLLERQRETDLAAFANADVPFEQLVEVLNPVRSTARHPLFQVGFAFQNQAPTLLELPGLDVSGVEFDLELSQFDLNWIVTDTYDGQGGPAGMSGSVTYATDMFDPATVAEFIARWMRLLESVAADPTAPVGDIDLLTPTERDLVLDRWNATEHGLPAGDTLVSLFTGAAATHADATALVYEGTRLSYAEFAARVNRLARWLISQGVGPDSRVVLGMRRSVDLVVSMYAVHAAGAAYVPVDPAHPVDRTGYVVTTADPVLVLTTVADGFGAEGAPVVEVDTVDVSGFDDTAVTDTERRAPLRPTNIAYLIFTSGSTGRPKGVAITHEAIVNQMRWFIAEYGITGSDVYLQKTATTFDVSLWGYFAPLQAGAELVVATPDGHRDPGYLADTIAAQGVTLTDFVPSMLGAFAAYVDSAKIASLRAIFVIGEALPAETVAAYAAVSDARVHNLYGPTEAAVSITAAQAVPGARSVSIGMPQWNSRVMVLDGRLRPVPVGVAGELYLSGVQLARGYHTRPDLTADRFVANPFGDGERMYRSGDLVRWSAHGELEYIGRTDFQVKFRGQRIELGEIESALLAQEGVNQSAALVVSAGGGEHLVGYVVPVPDADLDPSRLRTALENWLPPYMVPAAIVVLDALPLNPSGKLDRKALPAPMFAAKEFRQPATPVEEIVAGTFAEVLGVDRVGADDDFFALGGNSLVATRVAARIGAALETRVPVRLVFEAPTVTMLAARVESQAREQRVSLARQERPGRIPLSLAQTSMWILNQVDIASPAYNIPLAISLTGDLDIEAFRLAVADVVERHEPLRTRYPAAEDGTPYQEIMPAATVMSGREVTPLDADDAYARVIEMAAEGFDVSSTPPVRTGLFRRGDRDYVFVLVVHHISADGSSLAPLARDLVTAYWARRSGDTPAWTPFDLHYADYAIWQRHAIGTVDDETSIATRQLAFWKESLAGLPETIELPTDRPRPPQPSMRGATVSFSIPAQVHGRLVDVAAARNATLFMALHAGLAALLARLSGSPDIAIGTPFAGRGEAALDDLVGMFVNTLTLRVAVAPATTGAELLDRSREADLAAFANADIPFEQVVAALQPSRSRSHHPLFQVNLAFENFEQARLELPGLTIGAVDTGDVLAKFDLMLAVQSGYDAEGNPAEITAALHYATDLFDEATVAAFGRRLVRILEAISVDPEAAIGDIDIFDEAERAQVLDRQSAEPVPQASAPSGVSLSSLLAAAVEEDPEATALVGEEEISYRTLDRRSSQLARLLIDRGCGPGSAVAVALSRSVESVVACWAIVKVGAALLPLDPFALGKPAVAVGMSDIAVGITTTATLPSIAGRTDELGEADWLALDDREVRASVDAQPARQVTYADRIRNLRGTDPAYIGGSVVTYDALAAAVERISDQASVDFESHSARIGAADSYGALLEVLVAGTSGATMLMYAAGQPTRKAGTWLAQEGVTLVVVDADDVAGLDAESLGELDTVVVVGRGGEFDWPEHVVVIEVGDDGR